MRWNLQQLYGGPDDPLIYQDLRRARNKAVKFIDTYRGKLVENASQTSFILEAVKEYERIHIVGMKPYLYGTLLFASDTQDETYNNLFHRVREQWHKISKNLVFFSLEIAQIPENTMNNLLSSPELRPYKNFFRKSLLWKKHCLSEPQERIARLKNLSGSKAFKSFYIEFVGSLTFKLKIKDRIQKLSTAEIFKLFNATDRSLREKSFRVFLKELGTHEVVFKNILNAVLLDHKLETEIRKHPYPMHRVLLRNEIDKDAAEMVLAITEKNYTLARKYLKLKGKFLGKKRIKITDVFAPLPHEEVNISFDDAKELINEAFEGFHSAFWEAATILFENGRIDNEVRKGKKEGAFCASFIPTVRPFISLSYDSQIKDVMTLAHEIGHGIHFSLASKQSYLNFSPPFILGEAMAVFAEMLLVQYILQNPALKRIHLVVLSAHLDNFLVTVFRQSMITRFEQIIHGIRKSRVLSSGEICTLWWGLNKEMLGDIVDVHRLYRWGWTYIPHLFQSPFYCLSYVFGGLLAQLLYSRYQEEGKPVADGIVSLMSAGAGVSPQEFMQELGMEPNSPAIWERGFKLFETMVQLYEGYANNAR